MEIGRQAELGIGIENDEAVGTGVAPQVYIPFLEMSLNSVHEPIADVSAKGMRDMEGGDSVEGKKHGEGSVKVVLDPETAPYFFLGALGSLSSVDNTGYYTHTITKKDTNPPTTLTFWKGREIDSVNYPYGVINTLTLNFSDDVATLEANILSKYEVVQARTATYSSLDYLTFRDATVSVGTDIDSVAEIKVKELNLEINNNAEVIHESGDNDANRIAVKGFRVSGSMTIVFEDDDELDAYNNLDKRAIKIVLTGDSLGELLPNKTITIDIPRFRVENRAEDLSNDEVVTETIDFVAEYDSTEEHTIEITVVNSTSGYAHA